MSELVGINPGGENISFV